MRYTSRAKRRVLPVPVATLGKWAIYVGRATSMRCTFLNRSQNLHRRQKLSIPESIEGQRNWIAPVTRIVHGLPVLRIVPRTPQARMVVATVGNVPSERSFVSQVFCPGLSRLGGFTRGARQSIGGLRRCDS